MTKIAITIRDEQMRTLERVRRRRGVPRSRIVQQAAVIAVFAYDAAMRDEKLPRKALPAPQRGRSSSQ